MKIPKLCLNLAIAAIAVAILATPTRSFADTYQIVNLNSDQGYFFSGMDDAGHAVINNPTGCGIFTTTCYFTFLNGVSTGITNIAPTFIADNGTPCTPTVPAGGSVQHGVCNNGRDAFTGFLSASQVRPNVYVGPTFQDIFSTGGGGFIFMNGLGDIVFDDTFNQAWYEAVDLNTLTPEPSSLLLLATGILALAAILRRPTSPRTSPS